MFMRVNAKGAHQLRPPLGRVKSSAFSQPFALSEAAGGRGMMLSSVAHLLS
jgi:hypothetical protein